MSTNKAGDKSTPPRQIAQPTASIRADQGSQLHPRQPTDPTRVIKNTPPPRLTPSPTAKKECNGSILTWSVVVSFNYRTQHSMLSVLQGVSSNFISHGSL